MSLPLGPAVLMGYLRPRRAPMPARPTPGGSLGGLSSYPPARTLTFNGYFSGAGIPQGDNPYSFSWGPAVRYEIITCLLILVPYFYTADLNSGQT